MTDGRLVLSNCRAVVDDRVVDGATVVCEDGRITDVSGGGRVHGEGIDCGGDLLLPGLIDTHSDGLEKEIRPRRSSEFPIDFALRSFEGRVAAAGVTTLFHGVGFEENPDDDRTLDQAVEVCEQIRRRRAEDPPVDHRILYRLEARSEVGIAPLLARLGDARDGPHDPPPPVSFEDHTPGQGQFRDLDAYKAFVDPARLPVGVGVDEWIERRQAEAAAAAGHRDRNLAELGGRATTGDLTLLAHDCEAGDDVERALDAGARIAEFPLSVEAASAAREAGMAVVMGAPNVVRGGSHSGNVSASDLVAEGLCTVLASDYQPSTLLGAVFLLVERGVCPLPDAVGLVTSGPAEAMGLSDRGRLAPGARADLALVRVDGRWPRIRRTWRGAGAPGLATVG